MHTFLGSIWARSPIRFPAQKAFVQIGNGFHRSSVWSLRRLGAPTSFKSKICLAPSLATDYSSKLVLRSYLHRLSFTQACPLLSFTFSVFHKKYGFLKGPLTHQQLWFGYFPPFYLHLCGIKVTFIKTSLISDSSLNFSAQASSYCFDHPGNSLLMISLASWWNYSISFWQFILANTIFSS